MVALSPRAPSFPRLRGLAATAASAVKAVTVMAVKPHKAALANLKAIPLTLAGAACIDFAAFHVVHGFGWLVTGVSLVLLEHIIADEDEPGRRV